MCDKTVFKLAYYTTQYAVHNMNIDNFEACMIP